MAGLGTLTIGGVSAKALIDSDLQPLWRSLEASTPSLSLAHLLLQPLFDHPRLRAADCREAPDLDGNDLQQLPVSWRRLFRFSPDSGTHSLHALTGARNPEARAAFLDWAHRRIGSSLHAIELPRERAAQMVLQSQSAYAALHLTAENHLAARCHLLWAFEKDPTLLNRFRTNRELRPLRHVLDELSVLYAADPEWTRRLIGACLQISATDEDDLLEEEAPAASHGTSLLLLRSGHVLQNSGAHAAALSIWLRLCMRWPHDSVAFGNGVTCLVQLGLWDRAQALLSRAPRAYRHFHLCTAQQKQIAARDIKAASAPPTQPFRGQPDLGGVLCSGIPS